MNARRRIGAFGVAVVAAGAVACRSHQPDVASVRVPTFNHDIAPIVFKNCATCHRPARPDVTSDGPDPVCIAGAPFSLLEYRDVRAHAKEIAAATKRRAMPPWLPEHGYGDFANERRLRDEQIATIESWVAHGAPEGEPAEKPSPPTWPDGWQLGQPDLVLTMPEPYVLPAGQADMFRNFVFPVNVTSTKYVRAIEFNTENPRVIHHASVAVDAGRVSRRLDRADPGPGFAAMPDDQVKNVFGWSPGKSPFMEPADRAWTLGEGSDLVAQLHLLPTQKAERIAPRIGLYFGNRPPTHEPLVIALQSKTIDIPAGDNNYSIEDRYELPADVDVVSVYPHAHYLAREMQGVATLPDGSNRWLLWIKEWDFNWQDKYEYRSPVFLPKGTVVRMRFTYDNSDGNPHNRKHPAQRVQWGPKSSDEMGALWLEVIPTNPADGALLNRDYVRRSMIADLAAAEARVVEHPNDPLARNYLATKYLQAGRIDDALANLDAALHEKSDDPEAHSNLAMVFQLQHRMNEAVDEAVKASRLAPNDDRVQFNLGFVMQSANRLTDAVGAYRRAIALNDENVDAHFNLALILGPNGRIDEAVEHLRRALAVSPQRAEVHRNLGVALKLQGRRDEAIDEFRRALRLDPNSEIAKHDLDEALRRVP